ncbi:hypothetical protein MFUM_180001 [Methylacidiphilum fumariolicum SolV]|uniref:Uncharacterized protein n=2 Tax=Candidatus Methylacidiphilum fumarolicum TaxID=591154 RepID=I0JWL3_METFB|nr:hypothetical protein [Candidatus Methylacidiphilum fumarolicum]CAI9085573.1 conserved protein of unknown function [Candidatus Methylacidiphilum fumarolicum]CCG91632.1 hypothetical protein MFUM_180001 [Methylacidiphilum fumariolicum SolV]
MERKYDNFFFEQTSLGHHCQGTGFSKLHVSEARLADVRATRAVTTGESPHGPIGSEPNSNRTKLMSCYQIQR